MTESSKRTHTTLQPASPATIPSHQRTLFAGDVIRVVFGASSAQLFSILAAPVLSRIYAPEAFGLMAVFTSLVGVLGVMVGLRYEQAILLPERDEDAANVLVLALLITTGVSGVLGLLVLFYGGPILRSVGAAKIGPYAWLIPASILLSGLYQSVLMWNSRKRDFAVVSGSRTLYSGVSNTCQLSCGFIGWRSGASLIGSAFIGNLLALVMVVASAWRRSGKIIFESVRWVRLRWAAKRYSEFPLYNSWGILLNTLSWQLPALLLARYFGSASAGYFSIGMRVLSIPMDLVAASIGQVFFQRTAEASARGDLPQIVEAALRRLIAFGIFPVLMIALVGPDLFGVVFGNQWRPAGVYLRILSVWICVWFISSPLSTLTTVLEKQGFFLWMNCLILGSRWASIAVGAYLHSDLAALALFSVSGVLVYGYQSIVLVVKAGVSMRTVTKLLGRHCWPAIPAIAMILLASRAGAGPLMLIALAITLTLVYLLHTVLHDPVILRLLYARGGSIGRAIVPGSR